MSDLFRPLTFRNGSVMSNRFMLAPLTNQQSHPDGTLSQAEHDWLMMRAKGGFGAVMTAAAFVQPEGRGFAGQIGIDGDYCLPALTRWATDIRATGCLAIVQLYHAGLRAAQDVSGIQAVAPSADAKTGARAMTTDEVEAIIGAFVAGAERAKRAGFDGVELHGAHTYLLCEFLSPEYNRRDDQFGGSLENRAGPIREIIHGIRKICGTDFNLGLRLSPERMGLRMADMVELAGMLLDKGNLDYLDMSLWHIFNQPEDPAFAGKPLIEWFANLDRGDTRLGVAGHIRSGEMARDCMNAGADFVLIGRAAIPHHDFPLRVRHNPDFEMAPLPLQPASLIQEGVTAPFMEYLRGFSGFLVDG